MGQQQSKDELLYQQVNYGNVDGIKALRSEGAGVEWVDSEGKTALIVACMNPELYSVAKVLIELGANVNAYRPGRHAGTPLHHAAKRGLEQTVKLLLSRGANALIVNDDVQSPLDIARAKGFSNVVRVIEEHVCLFSGWLQQLHGPGFLKLLAPQFHSKKVWVVILPCGSRNLRTPLKLELAIYAGTEDAQPRTIIALWKANLDETNFNKPDPAATIMDFSSSTRIKLAAVNESEKHQLQRFCNACKGIPQVMHSTFPINNQVPTAPATAPTSEDEELEMAINASLQSAAHEIPSHTDPTGSGLDVSTGTTSNSMNSSTPEGTHITPGATTSHETSRSESKIQEAASTGSPSVVHATIENPSPISVPSAPPISDVAAAIDDSPSLYPEIDTTPVDSSSPTVGVVSGGADEKKEASATSSCTICMDAPLEGACIPCGHMAGCMSCLNEIRAKKWGCPVCRTKIDQVVRIYAV